MGRVRSTDKSVREIEKESIESFRQTEMLRQIEG
jgi:hypothetical protein